jgi:hypothetical protein
VEQKEALIKDLVETRRAMIDIAQALPSEMQYRVFLGVWSAADLIAHLIGWDYTNIEAIGRIQAGELPAFYAHRDRDWKTYNEYLVGRYKREDFDELLHDVAVSHQKMTRSLEQLPAKVYSKDHGVRVGSYRVTIERLMQAELKDEKEHLQQLVGFVNATSTTFR